MMRSGCRFYCTLDGLVMVVSNSCEIGTLKFDDTMSVLLSKEPRRKSSDAVETSRSARVSKEEEG